MVNPILIFTPPQDTAYVLVNPDKVITNIQLEKGSTATSYEPYENICPIEGWDGIEINICGKNWFDKTKYIPSTYLNASGVIAGHNNYNLYIIPVKPNTRYLLWRNGTTGYPTFGLLNKYPESLDTVNNYTTLRYKTEQIIDTGDNCYVVVALDKTDKRNHQLELGSTKTPYEPYQGTTQTITFPKTIYGGYVDLVNGKIIEIQSVRDIYASESVSASSRASGVIGASYSITNAANNNALKYSHGGIRSRNTASSNYMNADSCCLLPWNTNPTYVLIGSSSSIKKSSEYQGWIESLAQPLQVLYELNIPQSYSLDIDTLATLKNTNTLFSNANGNITVRAIGNVLASIHSMDFVRREINGAPHIESKTGNYLTFNTDMEMPLTSGRVYFTPKQDLHGYSKPWVGGAGKNLFDISTKEFGYINQNGVITADANISSHSTYIPVENGKTYTFSGINENSQYIANKRVHGYDENKQWVRQLAMEHFEANTPSNYAVTFTVTEDIKYVCLSYLTNDTNVMLELGSTATAYEPYENICPIEGWDGVTVTRCGKNIYSGEQLANLFGRIIYEDEDGKYIGIGGGKTYNFPDGLFKENTVYTFIFTFKGENIPSTSLCYYITYTDGSSTSVNCTNGLQMIAKTTVANKTVKGITQITRGYSRKVYLDGFGIFEGIITANDFEPYSGTTQTIQFPKTIYGGYVDLVRGEVVETEQAIDLKDVNWQYSLVQYRFYKGGYSQFQSAERQTLPLPYIACNVYNPKNWGSHVTKSDTNDQTISFNAENISVRDLRFNDSIADFKEYLESENAIVVLRLVTPNTYTLTLTPITTLSGTNNLWTTANGNIQISYYRHSDDSYQHINAQAIASNDNYLLVTDDGFVIGNEENVTIY